MKKIFLATCILCIMQTYAQTKVPGNSYFNSNNYVEYIYGNLPIIISVPHGGRLTPTSIPNRTDAACGASIVTVTDNNTQELARAVDTAFKNLLGCRPHIIISKLDREKLDPNRPINEGACTSTIAQTTWYDYQNFLDTARRKILADYGRGLFIDLHGQGHTIQRNELGYLIDESELRLSNTYLNQTAVVNNSSIKKLVSNNTNNYTHAQLLRGTYAFGTLLANAGYPSVPSLQDPYPQIGDAYFNGGYNTLRWGSRDSGTIDAFQIECNNIGVRDNYTNIKKFADTLAHVIKRYIELHIMTATQFAQCNPIVTNNSSTRNLFSIYPNPSTNNKAVVSFATLKQAVTMRLLDISGRVLQKASYQLTTKFNLNLPYLNGIYFIEITADNVQSVQKILIAN